MKTPSEWAMALCCGCPDNIATVRKIQREVIEEACRAVCAHCSEGSYVARRGNRWVHGLRKGGGGFAVPDEQIKPCDAADIRALAQDDAPGERDTMGAVEAAAFIGRHTRYNWGPEVERIIDTTPTAGGEGEA